MNDLSSLGIILLAALLIGHLVQAIRIPEVTGYLFAGVLVGPSVLGFISHENLSALQVFSEVGLGLILFSIGATFNFSSIRKTGGSIAALSLSESLLTLVLVTIGMLITGQSLAVALLLGAIAIETGAASTLMVLREVDSRGPLTDAVTSVIALNNIMALVVFSLVAAGLQLHGASVSGSLDPTIVYNTVFPVVWQFAGSAALGYLVGLLLAAWASRGLESGELLILMIGCVLLTVGLASWMGASPLMASLFVGTTLTNLSSRSRHLFDALSRTDPPLYVIFFVLAGAELDLRLLPSLGVVGLMYIACRCVGKIGGTFFAARRRGLPAEVRKLLGVSILAQAGLAIGLVLLTKQRFPEMSTTIATVVLGAVAAFELIGPISARQALVKSGEVGSNSHSRRTSIKADDLTG
ncbi:MAG: cation:proton antiporter [Longimicrobiales bacterium]